MYKTVKGPEIHFIKTAIVASLMVLPASRDGVAAVLDTSFDPGTGANNTIYATAVDSGKVIIGGSFTSFNGTAVTNIARLNSDGSLDTSFQGTAPGPVYTIALQTIGGSTKIVMGGQYTSINRLNADGSTDTGFTVQTLNHYCTSIAIDPVGGNNKILIGGEFTSVGIYGRPRVARLNNDGSLDTSFNPYYGANNTVYSITADDQNRVIVGGAFTTLVTSACTRIGRFTSSGSFDSTFSSSADATVYAVVQAGVQNAGSYEVLVGGALTSLSGSSRDRIGRVDHNGTIVSWSCSGANSAVYTGLIHGNDYFIGGTFTNVNGVLRYGAARIDKTDGCTTSWNDGSGITGGPVEAFSLYPSGSSPKLIVGGSFTSVEGTSRNRIARLTL